MSTTICSIEKPPFQSLGPGAERKSLLRDERGLAMTEAVVVLPFFIIVLAGLFFVNRLSTARLEAQVEAHNTAFRGALTGSCSGGEDGKGSDERVDGALRSSEQDVAGLVEQAGGDSLFDWSHQLVRASVTADGLPELFGDEERKIGASARLLCNAEPMGGLSDVFFEMIEDWFSN